MSLLVKAAKSGPTIVDVTPASAHWKYVGFRAHRLAAGERVAIAMPRLELCIVVLAGHVDVKSSHGEWKNLGDRESVFEDRAPWAIYLPDGAGVEVKAHDAAEIGVASAPGGGRLPPRVIDPSTMTRSVRGQGSNTRYVTDILPENEPAEHLLVVEVRTPPGHSSSYPPHKHDTDAVPVETQLEETYYHRLSPPQGFAFQRVYTDDRSLDEAMAVEDGDVTLVPKGYHPCAAIHGYDLYYLNVMAGPKRVWKFHNAKEHEWLTKV